MKLIFSLLLSTAISVVAAPEPKPKVSDKVYEATRLQVFLDQAGFRPGVIDGTLGGFTEAALQRYQRAFKWSVTRAEDHKLPLASIDPPFTRFTVRDSDVQWCGTVPSSIADQAKRKRLPYTSLRELVSERYHVDPAFLQRLNSKLKLDRLKPGDVVWVPNVRPFRIEDLPAEAKAPHDATPARTIRINTKERFLDLFENGNQIGAFPITPGSKRNPAPVGKWSVQKIVLLPWYRYDESVLEKGRRSEKFLMLPPGPNNPVGVVWMPLNKAGIGLHGAPVPENIGRGESHGCIRLANWDAVRLSRLISPGTSVVIE